MDGFLLGTIGSFVLILFFKVLSCGFLISFLGLKHKITVYLIYIAMSYSMQTITWYIFPFNVTYVDFIYNVLVIYLFSKFFLAAPHKTAFMTGCLSGSIWSSLNIFDFALVSILYQATSLTEPVIFVLANLVHTVALWATYYVFVRRYGLAGKYNSGYMAMFIVPISFVSLALQTIMSIAYVPVQFYEGDMIGNPALHQDLEILALSVGGLVCIYTILYIYETVVTQIQVKHNCMVLERENALQRRYIFEAKNKYASTQSFRHDFKNHILVLNGMLHNNDGAMALDYLKRFEEIEENFTFHVSTNNPIMDILLGEKLAVAEGLSIDISCNVNMEDPMFMDDFDLCTLFSNAIDNAMKACLDVSTTHKIIDIVAKRQKDFFVIDMINSYNPDKFQKGDGIGLQTMTLLTEKYGGTIKTQTHDATFRLSMLFPLDC